MMGLLKELEINYDLDTIEDYLTHFNIMNASLDKLIVNLSRDDKFQSNSLELNRIFHNIKTASQYLELSPIVKLSAIAEDITDRLKYKEQFQRIYSVRHKRIFYSSCIAD